MQDYPIPRTLWESLDAVLHAKGIALAKEIAREIGQPVQPLIIALNGVERSKFTLIPDEESSRYQCEALVKTGLVYMRCRSALLGQSKFCEHHHNPLDVPVDLTVMTRVIADESTYMTDGKSVYTLQGVHCGRLNGTRLTLFDVSE